MFLGEPQAKPRNVNRHQNTEKLPTFINIQSTRLLDIHSDELNSEPVVEKARDRNLETGLPFELKDLHGEREGETQGPIRVESFEGCQTLH